MAAGCATVVTPGLCSQCSARYATEHFSHTCAIHIEGWWLSGCTGADPEIEEGGHTYKVAIGVPRIVHSCLCIYNSVLGVWENIFKFRPYENASEAIRDHHNHMAHWSLTLVIHRMVISWSPFSSQTAFVFETPLQNYLLEAAVLSTL